MSELNDSSRIQSNYSHPETELRPKIIDVSLEPEETATFTPEDIPRGLTHDRLARRAQRIIRTYLAAGALVLAGSVVVTEHYKSDLKEAQRHAIDQIVDHAEDYAISLKSETDREFDKIVHPSKPSLQAPGPFEDSGSLSLHQDV